MVGETCLTERTTAPVGVQSLSRTSGTAMRIEAAIIERKSAASPAGSATMSTVPSSPEATVRSSSTSQPAPTPRQSQVNTPSQARTDAASWVGELVGGRSR